ncbi:MAG TPA: PIG-L family deacetylase [Actinospica sp.]|nr:PIG-L family deacetylase [Actinospica sp.]
MATVVAFHAHPDDEALLTGGTLARLVAEGHRVVLVVACDGEMGEARPNGGTRRLDELRASGCVLGVSRVVHLGYADSGHGPLLYPDPADRARFVSASPEEAAERLAELLRQERAEILVGYDPNGGYRHRDHIRVHEVALRAAEIAGTPRLMEATLPREPILRAYRVVSTLRLVKRHSVAEVRTSFTARGEITHRIDVRRYADKKRAALACHASQTSGTGRSARLFCLMTRLPLPVFARLFGREYYVEVGTPSGWLD